MSSLITIYVYWIAWFWLQIRMTKQTLLWWTGHSNSIWEWSDGAVDLHDKVETGNALSQCQSQDRARFSALVMSLSNVTSASTFVFQYYGRWQHPLRISRTRFYCERSFPGNARGMLSPPLFWENKCECVSSLRSHLEKAISLNLRYYRKKGSVTA